MSANSQKRTLAVSPSFYAAATHKARWVVSARQYVVASQAINQVPSTNIKGVSVSKASSRTYYSLPIFNTVWEAAILPFRFPSVFVRTAALFYLIIVCVFLWQTYAVTSQTTDIWSVPLMVMFLGGVAYFAVAWHRFIILGERQPAIIRFGRYEALYFAFLLIIGPGLEFLFQTIIALLENVTNSGQLLMAWLFIFGILAIFLVLLAAIIAPTIAVGKFTLSIVFYWKMMTKNRLRFLGILIFSEVIVIISSWISKTLYDFLTWDVVAPAFNYQAQSPQDVDPFSMLAVYAPSSILLGFVLAYLTSFAIGVLSISYCRLAGIK